MPVEDDTYFLTVLRYIIQNPVVAGICKHVEDYVYSSASDYCTSESGFSDTSIAKELLRGQNISEYLNHIEENFEIPDMEESHTISDSEALIIISVEKKRFSATASTAARKISYPEETTDMINRTVRSHTGI